MPRPKKNSRPKRVKHVTAQSISLVDAKGKLRIHMDAGDGSGYAVICLYGEAEHSIQISTSAEGGLAISLFGKRGAVSATLGMSPENDAGIDIRDRDGQLGTLLGVGLNSSDHALTLFKNGKPHWTTRKPPQEGKLPL